MEIRNYKWVALPIFLTAGVERHRVIEDAVRQIREIRDELVIGEVPPLASGSNLADAPDEIPENVPAK